MKILVINCGSSSLKYQLINMDNESVLAKGLIERIGIDGSSLTHKIEGWEKIVIKKTIENHGDAVKLMLESLTNSEFGVIKSVDEISAVGHRVVHAGEKFLEPVIINEDVKKALEECIDLAPLHNPANLTGIDAIEKAMPGKVNVGVWDTGFGGTLEPKAYLYAIPREYYDQYRIRRYGFHGISHKYVSNEAIDYLKLDKHNAKVIVCHLGNGASISASIGGKCVDTSMGFTPLEGLAMGTRSGDIDPAIIEYISNHEGITVEEAFNIINKKSGVYGLSGGYSSDFRDIKSASDRGDEYCSEAIEAYAYRVAKYIGAYVAAMNGVDAIIFTAGLGENAPWIRYKICEYLRFLGLAIDKIMNYNAIGQRTIISTLGSGVKVCVIPTNEELEIARQTQKLIEN